MGVDVAQAVRTEKSDVARDRPIDQMAFERTALLTVLTKPGCQDDCVLETHDMGVGEHVFDRVCRREDERKVHGLSDIAEIPLGEGSLTG